MVYQVSQGASGPGTTGTTLTYIYDADHTRIKETGPNGTTLYLNPRLDLGGHFEKITKPDGSIEYKHHLYAGGQSIGVYTTRSTGVNDTRYFHTDHLGSITVVTNETGAVVARFSYDPFGNRATVSGDGTVTHHGFTGHETMEEVGLVNMNGRIYDPALARFMSADPNIQAPGNGQSFNRYSYVLNNPLSYTDPTGFSWWTKIRGTVVRAIAAVADAYGCSGYCSAAVGAYQGRQQGGTRGAVVGAVTAYVGYQTSVNYPLTDANGINWSNVGTAASINATSGCANAAAGGGSCGQGAVAGAIGTVGNAYGFMGSVIAGCAAGRIGGGSCSDGAYNAVASYAVYSAVRYVIDSGLPAGKNTSGNKMNADVSGNGDSSAEDGRTLSNVERNRYGDYFSAQTLDNARIFDGKVPSWLRNDMDGITLGNNIYFRPGAYDPLTVSGIEILGHELVHVEQYGNGMTYVNYLWESRNGYRNNKYEIEAYSRGATIRSDYCYKNPGQGGC